MLSLYKSFKIIFFHRPDLIFSSGGYTSFPVVLMSKIFFRRIKVVLHEQNYVLGLTNKILKIFSDRVFLGFANERIKCKKYVFTGNPIRSSLKEEVSREEVLKNFNLDREKFTLLVFGGSQGAKKLNDFVISFLSNYENLSLKLQVIHITGKQDFERIKQLYQNIKIKHIVLPYLNEMHWAYTVADLVLSRAGAMTVSELIYFKKPSILVPFPFAAELHQNWNAWYLKKYNCAEVVFQRKNWEKLVASKILLLVNNDCVIERMKQGFTSMNFFHSYIFIKLEDLFK